MSDVPKHSPAGSRLPEKPDDLESRVADATALLEAIIDDRAVLAHLDEPARRRLLVAAGRAAGPDKRERRKLARARRRKEQLDRRADDEAVLSRTGIREKRRAAVFETPDAAGELPSGVSAEAPRHLPAPPLELTGGGVTGGDETLPPSAAEAAEVEHSEPAAQAERGEQGEPAEPRRVREARKCYVCKEPFHELHRFYDAMCASCAELNWAKRAQTADLSGRVALVTGARVKIGYQAAIKLLRAGAEVIVTTRFPRDAAARYARENDYDQWGGRLTIFGLDLRHTPSVERFCTHLLSSRQRLDFILNNACQTVRRPPGFYAHLLEGETRAVAELPAHEAQLVAEHEALHEPVDSSAAAAPAGVLATASAGDPAYLARGGIAGLAAWSAQLTQLPLLAEDLAGGEALFPSGQLDADLQQVDRRDINSWRLTLAEVPAVELLEVHLVNAVAPFILNARLRTLMRRAGGSDKHIVNVSAMEGQFYRAFKTDKHPHTNMAKAALNMMTRTSAADYVQHGIHMNSVDTGWVTDEDPIEIARRKTAEHGFHPPLDIVDGAARICDPIFDGLNSGRHVWGLFLKDYKPIAW